mgnify:CR=1 FL=1
MMKYQDAPTHRLLIIAALYIEMERPMPTDLVLTLNSRGIVFDEEEVQCLA